jgi:excisionase family DNA binding protein
VNDALLLKIPEVAALLQISKTKAWEMASRGDIPGVVRLGRNVRVSRVALEEWVRERAAAA